MWKTMPILQYSHPNREGLSTGMHIWYILELAFHVLVNFEFLYWNMQFIELFDVKLSMLGSHQLQNAATATCAALCLRDQGADSSPFFSVLNCVLQDLKFFLSW